LCDSIILVSIISGTMLLKIRVTDYSLSYGSNLIIQLTTRLKGFSEDDCDLISFCWDIIRSCSHWWEKLRRRRKRL